MEQGLAVMAAANATVSPVILQDGRRARACAKDVVRAKLIDVLVDVSPHIPACMHLDHGNSLPTCVTKIQ